MEKGATKIMTPWYLMNFKYRFGIELKDKGDAFNADPSLETKYRCVVKRDGVYGKTQYNPLTKRYTPWRHAQF